MIPISYCRHCGRRVASAKRDKCVYCGLSLTREPEVKLCPFCTEPIRSSAVKCRFCGEFVDGRERPAAEGAPAPAGPSNVQVFVIDKALVNTTQDLMVEGGQPVPPALAQRLPPQARRAIETNRPHLLPPGQVRALPAPRPEDPGVVDVEARPAMADAEYGPDEAAGGALPLPALAAPVEPWKTRAPKIAGRASVWTLKKLGALGWAGLKWGAKQAREALAAWLARRAAAKDAARLAEQAQADAPRQCPGCGVEVHPLDLFCFNCGKRIGKGTAPFEEAAPARVDAAVRLWVRLALVLGLFGWAPVPLPACQVRVPVAIVGLLCGIVALLRIGRSRRRVRGRAAAIAGILLAVFWLCMIPLMKRAQVRVPVVEKFWRTAEPAADSAPDAVD